MSYTPFPFLKQPPYVPTPPSLWEKATPSPPFLGKFWKLKAVYKGEGVLTIVV